MKLSARQLRVLKSAPNSAYDLFKPEFLFHSNKMEGSTFSELELQRLVDEGIVLGQHTIDDVLETRNSLDVFDYVVDTLGEPLTHEMLFKMNTMLFRGTEDEKNGFTGRYKVLNNYIRGASISTAYPQEVPGAIEELIAKYGPEGPADVESIARFHSRFEHIHPFQNGNGRIGRFLIMKQCIESGVDLVLIDSEFEKPYKTWLEVSQADGVFGPLVQTFEQCQRYLDEKAAEKGLDQALYVPPELLGD